MAACRRVAWAEWTCNEGLKSRNLSVSARSDCAGTLNLDVSANCFVSVRGKCALPCSSRTLKVADRDPLMNPRVIKAPQLRGFFLCLFVYTCRRVQTPRAVNRDMKESFGRFESFRETTACSFVHWLQRASRRFWWVAEAGRVYSIRIRATRAIQEVVTARAAAPRTSA